MDPDAKLFYRKIIDFGPGVGMREGQRKYEEEKRKEDERKKIYNEDVAINPNKKFLDTFIDTKMAGVPYTVNPPVSFITGGTGKVIKFHHPLDLRTTEEKMQRYPFVGYRS